VASGSLGLDHRISTVTHGKFPIDIFGMTLDGAGRNVELVGNSTFYDLFGSSVSCLRIKRLRDLEIEFLICEILLLYLNRRSVGTP